MAAAGHERASAADGDFRFRSGKKSLEEVMVYFCVDRAIRYIESLGFRGERAIFMQPLGVNAHATRSDSSWYGPGRKKLFFGPRRRRQRGRERRRKHENGMPWVETLLAIKAAVGRRVADTIVVEAHFQQDGFTTFARGARAILDPDRNVHRGRHARALREVFAWRGIGPI